MNSFTARNVSQETVPYSVDQVWDVLISPGTLQRITPLVRSIEEQDDRWLWRLTSIPVLSRTIEPVFTEIMEFEPKSRISFTHDREQAHELAGVEGVYGLKPKGSGTHLSIDLAVTVRMPFPKLAGPAMRAAMTTVLNQMGNGFARNLDRHMAQAA